ncbi:MAG: SAM-dependent methyltransferase [Thermoplasmatales archaeon I-plasma]|nr:MAG: SAM-dependent methyltransferase [Thermoplasmatales archaeon I-plasma]
MGTLENMKLLMKNFKNWLGIGLRIKFTQTKQLKVVLRSGENYVLWRNYILALLPLVKKGMIANYAITCLLEDKIPFGHDFVIIHGWIGENNKSNGDVIDVFLNEDYRFLDVKDRVVVDIGANIGDSAIYFALNGATKVISLEPYPYSFAFAVKNVKENNLDERILLLNAGYGRDGTELVNENLESNHSTALEPVENGRRIIIYSLKTLVEKFKLDGAVLKMDCEGCEYDLCNEDEEVLRRFSEVQIEYHYGVKGLVEKLRKSGFNVKHTKSRRIFYPGAEKPMMLGYIYAIKQRQQD